MDPKKEQKHPDSNPFSSFLRSDLRDADISDFVDRWDQVERMVIRTYRREAEFETDQPRWRQLRKSLLEIYPRVSGPLEAYWKKAAIAGQAAADDPFLWILDHQQARSFENNWQAMQTLPAAREAINRLLISREK